MEKTNFTFVRPFGLAMVLSVLFTILGLQVANAQCNPPAPVAGPIVTTQSSAVLSWTSTSLPLPPNDHCWVLQVASQSVLLQGANGCPRAGEAIVQTTICANGVFGAPGSTTTSSNPNVTVVRNGANSFTATVNGLPAGTQLRWFINELCDGIVIPNFTDCVEGDPFMTRDAQFDLATIDITPPTCPLISPGFVADGEFTVRVIDGSTCAGMYTVTVVPALAGSPVVGTPGGVDLTFTGAAPGNYTVTVLETSGCNPVTNPRNFVINVPDGTDTQDPFITVTDLLGNVIVTNDPTPPVANPPGMLILSATLPTINVPEGECGSQERFFAYGYDTCDGVLNTPPSISATAVTTPATINPGTQVTVDTDGFGVWDIEVHWSTGTSVVTVTGRDASNNTIDLTIQRTVIDNIDPIVTILGSSQVTIPVCATTAVVPYTVQVDDLCDQEAVNFANLTLTRFSGNAAGIAIGTQFGASGESAQYNVTFSIPGTYELQATYTDASGNSDTEFLLITVQQAAADQPPVIIANAEDASIPVCEAFYDSLIYSFTITDDCQNIVRVPNNNFTGVITGLVVTGMPAGMVQTYSEFVNNGNRAIYVEFTGDVAPGTYFPVITYTNSIGQVASVNPSIVVEQNVNQPADIVLPAINVTIPQCQAEIDVTIPVTVIDDCDNPVAPGRLVVTLDGVVLTSAGLPAEAGGLFEYTATLDAADAGDILVATYTDAQGAVRTVNTQVGVTAQPDLWAPIIIYPSQDINVELDPCDEGPAAVFFEITATDNCDLDIVPTVTVNGVNFPGGNILNSIGGDTYLFIGFPGIYQVEISAEDDAGNLREEDFFIVVTQDPRPETNLGCNDNINVTLNANCQALIVPDMVLEGDFGCLENQNFAITVVDGNVANGPIVDGCGTFNYNISRVVPPAPVVNGFNGAFAPANWTVIEDDGPFGGTADVTFGATTLTLSTLGAFDAIAAIAMPTDGNLRFNWTYNGADPNFDFFIVDVDNNEIVLETNASAGSVNEDVEAGWVLVLHVFDDSFLPIGPDVASTAVISNFVFTGTVDVPTDFTQCWGTLTAEDKTKPVIDCPEDTDQAVVNRTVQTFQGALANTDPTLNLANYSCFTDFFNPAAGLHFYDLHTFTVSTTDIYTFEIASSWGDAGMALFQGAFNPANPCENIIGTSQDQIVSDGGLFSFFLGPAASGAANPNEPIYRLALPLRAGETYTLMTSSWPANQTGTYTWAAYSDGNGVLTGVNGTVIGAPTTERVFFDLICDDLDRIVLSGLPANVPRCYRTDRLGNVVLPTNAQQRQRVEQLLALLAATGYPNANPLTALGGSVRDNCGWIEICVTETVTEAGNCGDWTISRTFSAKDKQGNYVVNSPCTGTPNTAACTQIITVRKPDIGDVSFPPFVVNIECDEDFPTLANGNPSPAISGYPFVITAFGIHDIAETYCNLAAQFSDQARIQVCEGGYKLLRNWTFFDWCNPGTTLQFIQIIKVGDFTAPEVDCPAYDYNWDGVNDLPTFSTGPFNCTASFAVPNPIVTDNCSDWTTLTEIVTTIQAPVYNQWGQQIGTQPEVVVVATIPHGANRFVSNIPIGCHRFRYTVTDDCDNVTVIECDFLVEDQVEPRAVCDDDLNISVGGQGIGRVYAEDIDEGSNDNCGPIRIEVRRQYTENPNTCAPVSTFFGAEENGALPWGDYVDFTCCDVHSEVRIELRVWDDRNGDGIPGNTIAVTDCWGQTRNVTDNSNICWLDVLVEDKINPVCIPPHPVAIDCDDVPYDFNPLDTLQMQELFGEAEAADNCPGATIRELSPIVNLHDCGFGSITRRFQASDVWGNLSGICTQAIQIREVHNYEIKFPADVEGICGPLLFDTVITTTELGCDLLAVTVLDEPFSASGDECYKIFRRFRVVNWCEYDGISEPRIVNRDEDCDQNPGDEAVWVLVRPNPGFNPAQPASILGNPRSIVYYDRDNIHNNNIPLPNTKGLSCDGITNPSPQTTGHWINSNYDINATRDPITGLTNNAGNPNLGPNDVIRTINTVGLWEYTQIIKVYDNIKPIVNFEQTDPFCSLDNVDCDGPVEVPFSIDENCTPDDLTIKVFLDAFSDGVLDGNVTASVLSGTYPDYLLSGVYPIGCHVFEVHVEDGCGNFTQKDIPFCVVDCKAPVPICINGLAIELMPTEPNTDADGDGDIDTGAMGIWASDFLVSPQTDCTGPIKYSIHRSDEVIDGTDVPDPSQTGIVLTCDDFGTLVVRIYAWDSAFNPYAVQPDGTVGGPNFDWCETYVLVQDNMFDLCDPDGSRIAGLIETEESEAVADVQVSLSGNATDNMTTPANGTYGFDDLQTGAQGDYTVAPELDAFPLNGVSTFDLVLISRHILGVQPLGSPYKMIAADVNNDKKITTIDLIHLRKLILAIDTEFASNTSWRFVRADYAFPVPTNPWFEVFPEVYNVNDLAVDILNADFIAMKIGDVNSSAATSFASLEPRTIEGVFALETADQKLTAGNEYTVTFKASEIAKIQGYQGTLTFNRTAVELVNVEYAAVKEDNFGMRYATEGMITTSWNGEATASDVLFSLVLRAKTDAQLSEVLGVSSAYTVAEAYNKNDGISDLAINFGTGAVATAGFELYQNTPNPFKGETRIGFNLPEAADATISIQDVTGKVLRVTRIQAVKGYNMVTLNSNELGAVGVLSYTVTTADFTATKQMIIVE